MEVVIVLSLKTNAHGYDQNQEANSGSPPLNQTVNNQRDTAFLPQIHTLLSRVQFSRCFHALPKAELTNLSSGGDGDLVMSMPLLTLLTGN